MSPRGCLAVLAAVLVVGIPWWLGIVQLGGALWRLVAG